MVCATEVVVVLDRELQALAPPRMRPRARLEHQQVTEDAANRRVGLARQRGADEVVARGGQERDLARGVAHERVAVLVEPALVDEVAVAEVLDPRAAEVERPRERARLGEARERGGGGVRDLLERSALMRRPERDHVMDLGRRSCCRRRSGTRSARPGRPSSGRSARPRRRAWARRRSGARVARRARGRSLRCGGRCCSAGRAGCSRARSPSGGRRGRGAPPRASTHRRSRTGRG